MARKTYKKKTSARRAAGKGASVYKVKGGYRVSRKRRKASGKAKRRVRGG